MDIVIDVINTFGRFWSNVFTIIQKEYGHIFIRISTIAFHTLTLF